MRAPAGGFTRRRPRCGAGARGVVPSEEMANPFVDERRVEKVRHTGRVHERDEDTSAMTSSADVAVVAREIH